MRGRRWSSAEDSLAQTLLRSGASYEEISVRVGHSVEALHSRNSLRWRIDAKDEWTREEENRLRVLWEEGESEEKIASVLGRTPAAILERKKRWGLERRDRKHPKTDLSFFKNWSPKLAYVIGFIVTDGNVSCCRRKVDGYDCAVYKAKITQAGDCGRDLLKRIQSVCGGTFNGPYHPKPVSTGTPQENWVLCWNGKDLIDALASYGIGPRKSFTVEVPPVPDEFFSHFFCGVVDGDGCITNDQCGNPVLSITSASEKFLKQIQSKLVQFVAIGGSICKIDKRSPASNKRCISFKIGFSNNQSLPVLEWMYKDKEKSFWLTRKWDKYQELKRKQLESI